MRPQSLMNFTGAGALFRTRAEATVAKARARRTLEKDIVRIVVTLLWKTISFMFLGTCRGQTICLSFCHFLSFDPGSLNLYNLPVPKDPHPKNPHSK
ncbi:hypothetical protein MT325_m276L [Paramecium bursaria chlorella virus MT325]|uniref:Uncharacterized protein m276L n=1 Tax=Paramecium bursaria Chlorella virus MT325 TaxID=346932 RepID=A7IU06_PBCVM|nr:hypothetical protein MT325_m276L [Paramecium bursaria chlorella virus MT325]